MLARFKVSSLNVLEKRHNTMAYSECHCSDEGVKTISHILHGMITSVALKKMQCLTSSLTQVHQNRREG